GRGWRAGAVGDGQGRSGSRFQLRLRGPGLRAHGRLRAALTGPKQGFDHDVTPVLHTPRGGEPRIGEIRMLGRALFVKPGHLAVAVVVALGTPGMVFAQQAEPAEQEERAAARTLDTVRVTGSHIRRTDAEAQLPITVFQRADIEAQGITSAEQLLMYMNISGNSSDNLSSNSGIVHEEQRGNNGVSGANLR